MLTGSRWTCRREDVGDGPGSNVGTVAGGLGPVAEGVLRMAAAGVAVGWPVTPVAAGRGANQSP